MKFLHFKRFLVVALLAMMTNVCWADMIVVTDIGDYKYGLNSNNRTAMLYGFKTNYSSTADVNLVVPETVSSGVYQYTVIGINDQAFQGRYVIKSVSFPSTLETIGNYAFSGCDLGGDLTIGSSVTNIGIGAFAGGHFDDVYFNANLNIGSEVLNLLDAPFDNCSGQLHIGSNVVTIPAGLFRNTNFDGTLDLTNVQYIGTSAFMQSSNLTCGTVLNLSNVQQLGLNAFSGCSGLTGQLVLPNIETIPNAAFDGCSFTGTLVIPNNIKNIDAMAFRDNNFSSITFQATSNLTTIGDNAFYQGITGTSIEIPASVTYIGSSAFADCGNLTNITLQDNSSLTNIYGNAFNGTAWYNALGDNTIVYWYDWCMTYKGSNTSCALNIASVYGDYEIKHIAIEAFQVGMRKKFTSLSLPATLKTIGARAFDGCRYMTNTLVIPASVEVIGGNAFESCSGLPGITFESESSIKTISDHAFEDCSGLATDLVIPSSVTYLGTYAFSGCSSLTGLEFAEGCALEEIKSNAFVGCESMEGELEIPESVRVIGDNAFAGCLGFTGNLVIPDNVIIIGSEAFYDCSGFGTDLVLGSVVREIGDRAFYGCTGITNISIPEYVTYIGEYAFSNTGWMNNTTSSPAFAGIVYKDGWCLGYYGAAAAAPTGALTIADGTIGIASNAFSGLSGITSLVLPATVTTIGAQAFYNCSGLANIGDLSHIRRMGYHVFVGTAWADNNEDDVMYKDGCCLGWRGRDGGMMKGTNGMKSENYIIPEGTKVIADGAFDMYCFPTDDGYAVLILPSTLEVIGEGAFANCNINGDLTIPANVEYIGDGAIDGWQLSTIYYNAEYCESGFKGQYTDESQMGTTAAGYSYPIKGYNKLVIGAGVVGIPEKMFAPEFTEVEYRATDAELISWYSENATSPFEGFTGVLNIVDGVERIDYYMFNNSAFSEITIGSSVEVIGYAAFANCSNVSNVYYNATNCVCDFGRFGLAPNYFYTYDHDIFPFYACTGTLTIGNNVESIPDYIFCYGDFSGDLTIGTAVTSIGEFAFKGLSFNHIYYNATSCDDFTPVSHNLQTGNGNSGTGGQNPNQIGLGVDIPIFGSEPSEYSREFYPFYGCHGEFRAGDNVLRIPAHMFKRGCYSAIALGNSVETIGESAFYGCCSQNMMALEIPSSVITIGNNAFSYCYFNYLTMGDNVESIGTTAFAECNYLTSELYIPESMTFIGGNAFAGTPVSDIYYHAANCTIGEETLNYGEGMKSPFRYRDPYTPNGMLIIGEEVLALPEHIFEYCQFEYVSYNAINYYDANNNYSNTAITGDYYFPFKGCTGSLNISYEVTSIPDYIFGEAAFSEIQMQSTVTTIGAASFMNCTGIKKLIIPENVTSIDCAAFSGCTLLERIDYNAISCSIPLHEHHGGGSNKGDINDYPFDGSTAKLTIGDGVTIIGADMFANGEFDAIYAWPHNPPTINVLGNAFNGVDPNTPVYVLCDRLSVYENDVTNGWNYFKNYNEVCEFRFKGYEDNSWTNYNNWLDGLYPPAEANVFIDANCELNPPTTVANLTITNGYTLTFAPMVPTMALEVTGDLVNQGDARNLVIVDGQLFNKNDNVLATYKKSYFPIHQILMGETDWVFLSSPIVGDNNLFSYEVPTIGTISSSLFAFDQACTLEWQNSANHSFSIENGKGYLFAATNGMKIISSGIIKPSLVENAVTHELEAATETVDLDYVAGMSWAGWNLVGNPFPSNAYSNLSYYEIDDDGSHINPVMKSASTVVPPFTGIMVDAYDEINDVVTPTITFTVDRTGFEESTPKNNGYINIDVMQQNQSTRNNEKKDRVIVSFNEGDQLGKFVFNEDDARISIMRNGKSYGIAVSDKDGCMPLRVEVPELGFYTLSVNVEETELSYLHLIDGLTGEDVNLLVEPEYRFTAKKNDNPNRFTLVFRGPVNESGNTDIFAYQNGSDIIVNGDGELQVFDVMGRMVKATAINGIETINMPENGVYIFRMVGNDIKTQKIVVR